MVIPRLVLDRWVELPGWLKKRKLFSPLWDSPGWVCGYFEDSIFSWEWADSGIIRKDCYRFIPYDLDLYLNCCEDLLGDRRGVLDVRLLRDRFSISLHHADGEFSGLGSYKTEAALALLQNCAEHYWIMAMPSIKDLDSIRPDAADVGFRISNPGVAIGRSLGVEISSGFDDRICIRYKSLLSAYAIKSIYKDFVLDLCDSEYLYAIRAVEGVVYVS